MQEKPNHIKIFNLYYVMGSDRSLKKLWNKLNQNNTTMLPKVPSYQTLKRWSKIFSWQERIKQTDIEVSEILKKKFKKDVVNSKVDYRKLVKEVIDQFKEKLKNKKIKFSKPQDIIEMVKLDLLMMGEPTGREDFNFKLIDVDMDKYPKQKDE